MIDRLQKRLALARAEPGDGRDLARYRWWQVPGRALFHLDPGGSGPPVHYTVDVRHWGNQAAGTVRAQLFRDGRQQAVSKLPAAFAVEGGVIEVAMSAVGMKRCHYVTHHGAARQLRPDPRSAEGLRARFEDRHPAASRWVGVASVLALTVGIGLLALQVIDPLSNVPPVEEYFGHIEVPFTPPLWFTTTSAVLAATASTERALRLRYRSWIDAIGN
ncbi:hypothetical protein [Streptomonospora salina]|uniref:Uncharacterized protein n=1 Tax=Streptomonospora salina TaxID=104205 RepID=A0A841E7K9_9ACTN|nr:hypothetical protein [Streptomonospora salina]MBB5999927.1 hypothetical protein [Streptomonospora salina]